MITVTVPATTYDLTTVGTVKAELGITDRAEDARLQTFIRQASGVIAEFCNRTFAEETVAETLRLDCGRRELTLTRYPVTAVIGVTEDGEALESDEWEINSAAGILRRLSGSDLTYWPAKKIVGTYSAGYPLLQGLPYGIERACLTLIKQYRFAQDRDPLVKSETAESVGGASYFGSVNGSALSPEVAGLLTPHRNRNLR